MNQTQKQDISQAAYFKSLTLENVKCFKESQTIDFSENGEKPAQWTVILGNNNTGKTTILKCLVERFNITIAFDENKVNGRLFVEIPLRTEVKTVTYKELVLRNLEKNYLSLYYFYGNDLQSNTFVISDIMERKEQIIKSHEEGIEEHIKNLRNKTIELPELQEYAYGVTRKINSNGNNSQEDSNTESLFNPDFKLTNVEEWLIQLYLTAQKIEKAKIQLEKVQRVLTTGLLPDVQEINFFTEEESPFRTFISFKTDYGNISLKDLGYGYQTMLSWVLDFVKRMFERYPNEENPLSMPAVVLVDEIDLHLHPDWQRKIVAFLTKHFPNTQFIVTAHSPLIVQSAESVNVVLLEKIQNYVVIKQPQIKTFKGWTVEEILSELMGLEDKTLSETYLNLMKQFDEGLDKDDYEKTQNAYNELDKILHPKSNQRKLLRLQMSSLIPA